MMAILLLADGCKTVSISSNQYIGGPTYAATDPASVQILRTPQLRPHVRLGEITAEPSSDNVSVQKIETSLQKAAAKMGTNWDYAFDKFSHPIRWARASFPAHTRCDGATARRVRRAIHRRGGSGEAFAWFVRGANPCPSVSHYWALSRPIIMEMNLFAALLDGCVALQSLSVALFNDRVALQKVYVAPVQGNFLTKKVNSVMGKPISRAKPPPSTCQSRFSAAKPKNDNAVVIVHHRIQVTGAIVNGPWFGRSIQTTQGRVIIVAIR
jgi:hypothetical protein